MAYFGSIKEICRSQRRLLSLQRVFKTCSPIWAVLKQRSAEGNFVCPICDGFESQGKQIAVLGSGAHALREAQFLKTYSNDLTFIALTPLDDALIAQCLENNIDLVAGTVEAISIEDGGGVSLAPASGLRRRFDTMYLALGCLRQTQLLNRLLAEFDERGALILDEDQETSVSGLFAAGDVVRGLNQIVVSAAEGAIAATAIHNRLTAALVGR